MTSSKAQLDEAFSLFGKSTKAKLSGIAAHGSPEDQLRSPMESLIRRLAVICHRNAERLALVGETTVSELKTRPDYAVTYDDLLVGYVEIKAPGKGADPRKFKDRHDKEQWKKLSSLPNVIFTDGNYFSLWQNGQIVEKVVELDGDVETSGALLRAPERILRIFEQFFAWTPSVPSTPKGLAVASARLCRLIRDEVAEQLQLGDTRLKSLAKDWRNLLFPDATDEEFADGYAQAVTFGLLLARAQGISLENGIDDAAKKLASQHTLIGAALRVLTDNVVAENVLSTSVATASRVLAVVDWPTISKGDSNAWLYFYEDFLAQYDNSLRKETGSYYTPVEVVDAMTGFVQELLRKGFNQPKGFAESEVKVIDPALGTGTFLLSVLRCIAVAVKDFEGEGAVDASVKSAVNRLIGFEIQLGPFAVAQLRVLAELASLQSEPTSAVASTALRLYVTNTLGNPFIEEQSLGTWYEPIAESRRAANNIKKGEPVLVVLGNPPYKENSLGLGGWVESGSPGALQDPLLSAFVPPTSWGLGAHVRHLYNSYVYFWRWATWKLFEQHPESQRGILCFITVDSFRDNPGFQRMREYLRRKADSIWVIDCSPEGHMPAVSTRVFEGVKQPVCITIVARYNQNSDESQPAPVHFRRLPSGHRDEKFAELANISLDDNSWQVGASDWRAPFAPLGSAEWLSLPLLSDILLWSGTGIMSGRSWIYAPDKETLRERWAQLINAPAEKKPELMTEHSTDRRVGRKLSDALPGYPVPQNSIAEESGSCPEPVRVGFRSFDRQWIIPDKRLINRPNPTLWSLRDIASQVFLTVPEDTSPTAGPACTFTAEVPDAHHYNGRGGRVYPLWMSDSVSNVNPRLLDYWKDVLGLESLGGDEVFAYIAALTAHPAYTHDYLRELSNPGIRVPVTRDPLLFRQACELGGEVLWVQTYGKSFAGVAPRFAGQTPRMPEESAPKVLAAGKIPDTVQDMPDVLAYNAETRVLSLGAGKICNVTPRMREYQISGWNVIDRWFSYRKKDRERPLMGDRRTSPLLDTQPDRWLAEYTSELIDLLNVLGRLTLLEPRQEELLRKIAAGPLVSVQDLTQEGVFPVRKDEREAPKEGKSDTQCGTLELDF